MSPKTAHRDYLTPTGERVRRHVRAHGTRAVLAGISGSGVVAGFLDAAGRNGPLLAYVGLAIAFALATLAVLAVPDARRRRAARVLGRGVAPRPGRPPQLPLQGASRAGVVREVSVLRCDDPVYGAGLRALLAPSEPIIVIPSNRRDVGREHELPLPLFGQGRHRTSVEVDLEPFGIPLAPYRFERELPEGVQDTDHTLAVKDLVFVPELAAVLRAAVAEPAARADPLAGAPIMWPEHCVDPLQLAHRDVVVVGGPDTNFWHGALFEPVARSFATPPSSVPLAMSLREGPVDLPSYGSRALSVVLSGIGAALQHTRHDEAELDERLYPTYGMVLACRNPFAAAIGRSHWCVFVAGTRSVGTSGAVLALTMALQAMRDDSGLNFFSEVPTAEDGVRAQVSAILCRTVEVEQSVLRREGRLTPREVRGMAPEGLDPRYSDSYVPVTTEYLAYPPIPEGIPRWEILGRLADRRPGGAGT
jgi:hypothetical protein